MIGAGRGVSVSIADISIGMASVLLSVLAFLAAGRAAKTARETEEMRVAAQAKAVDADAYHRAQVIYNTALDQLRRQNADQQVLIERLSRQVVALDRALRQAGLPIPVFDSDEPGHGHDHNEGVRKDFQ